MSPNEIRDAWTSFIRARCKGLLGAKPYYVGPGSRERTTRLNDADAELEVYKEFGPLLRQTRNSLSPVGTLPAEVLALIFAFAQDEWEPKRIPAERTKSHYFNLGWIQVTHVSHTWRKVGLETAPLWRRLPCLRIPTLFASEIICRSRQLPLELTIDDWRSERRDTRSALSGWLRPSILRRTSVFCVEQVPSGDVKTWHALLIHPMPVLRELSLQLYHEDEDVIRLLPGAFTGSCPLLTSLTLANCFPQWDTHLFSSPLTHLTLATHWIDEDYDPLPTTAEFRAILAALPTLEELVLTNFYPKTPADGEQLNPLTLSNRFRRLTVDISCGSVYEDMNSNFWGSFIFPSTAAIYFEINLDDLESWDAEDGWHFLDPFTQLHDSGSDPQELYLSLDHMTMSYAENPLFSTRLCGLPIPSPSSRHVWAATELPLHLHRLRLAHLSSIRFTSAIQGHYTAPDAWVLAFSVATSIQRVTLTLRHVIPLLDALSATRPDGGMSLFPQMRTLIINSDTDGDEGKNGLELDMSLIDLVDIREGVGAPLQEIMVPEAISSWHIWTHIGEKATVTFYKYT